LGDGLDTLLTRRPGAPDFSPDPKKRYPRRAFYGEAYTYLRDPDLYKAFAFSVYRGGCPMG
jgi:hypothetical protein